MELTKYTSLKHYDKHNLFIRSWNVNGTEIGINVTKFKLGDLGLRSQDGRHCKQCQVVCKDIVEHTIINCQDLKTERDELYIANGKTIQNQEDIHQFLNSMNHNKAAFLANLVKKSNS